MQWIEAVAILSVIQVDRTVCESGQGMTHALLVRSPSGCEWHGSYNEEPTDLQVRRCAWRMAMRWYCAATSGETIEQAIEMAEYELGGRLLTMPPAYGLVEVSRRIRRVA